MILQTLLDAVFSRAELLQEKSAGQRLATPALYVSLVVIWTMRAELVRVVTAFDAGKAMRAEYFAERGW
jgi:hypothetical protein